MSPPPLTLLSFADLNSPSSQNASKNVLEPYRWCQLHLDALKVVVVHRPGVADPRRVQFLYTTAEVCDLKRRNFKIIGYFLYYLQKPVVNDPSFFEVAWTLSSFLSPTPWMDRGPTPIGYCNTHILRSFIWLVNCVIHPYIYMSLDTVDDQFSPQLNLPSTETR